AARQRSAPPATMNASPPMMKTTIAKWTTRTASASAIALEEAIEEARGGGRDADDLVGRLAVELEVELGLRPAVVPVREALQLASAQASRGERGALDDDRDARRLALDAGLLRGRLDRADDALRDEPAAAFVLAREDEDRVACADALAVVHRLLLGERVAARSGPVDPGLDRERRGRHRATRPTGSRTTAPPARPSGRGAASPSPWPRPQGRARRPSRDRTSACCRRRIRTGRRRR